MGRRLLASLTATAAVAGSLLIGSAGPATAADSTATSATSTQSGGVTPNNKLPDAIQVKPEENLKIVATLRGVGKQVYDCKAGKYELREPVAGLFTLRGAPAGIHGAGPFWANFDGSRVVAAKVASAPGGASNVDWLKLQSTANFGVGGAFSAVKVVQRIDTRGGVAPTSCTEPSTAAVDYSTNYVFWAPQ